MIKVLVIIPYKELESDFKRIIDATAHEGVEFTLAHFYGTAPDGIEPVSAYDIVVARGMTYHAVKLRYPQQHVIEMSTSSKGLLTALENVRDKYGQEARVGCVVPDSTIADEGVIKSLTGIDIRIREAKDEKLMSRIADELISDGYDILIGGGYLRAYCELHGIRFSAIGLEDFAISRAVNSAVSAAEIMETERIRSNLYRTIIEEFPSCILAVDKNKVVLSSNAAADAFFQHSLAGTSVKELFPEGLLEETLNKGLELESVQRIMDQDVIVAQRPLSSAGGSAVISLQTVREAFTPLDRNITKPRHGFSAKYTFSCIFTEDLVMRTIIAKAVRYAQTDCNVLVTGETGTGKELFIQSIHNASSRRNKPFVAINCASISADLLESELFGYVEGAFTGAAKGGKQGLFELADKGTIFLDEIGELPVPLQAKLLRVLQEKEVRRVGGSNVIPTDVRVLCATNQDIPHLVEEGLFRSDLYYRINLLTIQIPPLRARKKDIPLLFKNFVKSLSSEMEIPVPTVGEDALKYLCTYNWPGNIRELKNVAQRILILNGSKHIDEGAVRLVDIPFPSAFKEHDSFSASHKPLKAMNDEELYAEYIGSHMTLGEFAEHLGVSRTTLWRRFKSFSQ